MTCRNLLFAGLILGCARGFAAELPISGLKLNPALHLNVENSAEPQAGQGFVWQASNADFEVLIKGTPMKDEKAAQQMARVELANVKNLYNPHGSPYAGQISDLIECKKGYLPKTVSVRIGGHTYSVLMGGANGRRLFGACTADQIEYWGGYFSFYDTRDARAISVRAFAKAHSPSPAKVPGLEKQLKSLIERLWTETRS